MQNWIDVLMHEKTVSVWGMGYLGYTTVLRLQTKGFRTKVYDFNTERLEGLISGKYPGKHQKESWSGYGEIPLLNLQYVKVCKTVDGLFPSQLHIVCIPFADGGSSVLEKLVQVLVKHKEELKGALLMFQSAGAPGILDDIVLEPLKKAGVTCALASAFRSDWTMEEFFSRSYIRPLAANTDDGLVKVQKLFDLFDIPHVELDSIEEAEILENSRNALEYTISAFLNQMALAYPDTDIRRSSKLLAEWYSNKSAMMGFGTNNYRFLHSVEQLVAGADDSNRLTLLRESESANLSLMLHYADLIKREKVNSVTLWGMSAYSNRKETRMSPALMLAESLIESGITVYVSDPHYTVEELTNILPKAQMVSHEEPLSAEALVIVAGHSDYTYFSMEDIKRLKILQAKIIIDNLGILQHLGLEKETKYHCPGDGKLKSIGC